LSVLQLESVSLAYGDRDILSSVSMTLDSQGRTALAGANGSGKSTLMKIMCGLIQPDSGTVHISKDASVTYLPQSGYVLPETTLYAAVDTAFDRFHKMKNRLEQLEHSITELASSSSSRHERLLFEHHELNEELLSSGYYHRESRIFHVLQGLGFSLDHIHRPCREFSGGWQMRIALAKVLLEQADFLLLDEPTNYLDVEARFWLKQYIARYHGGVLLVSHDRDFLDAAADTVEEIFQGRLNRYSGNYSAFERQREERNRQLEALYAQQQQEIERIEQFIERFRYKDSKARQVQSRVRMLEKMERIELPPQLKRISFSFPPSPRSGNQIFTVEQLRKSYGETAVLRGLNFSVMRGNRIAVTGRNGAGKTTLLRILAGADGAYSGNVRCGTGISLGYYAQDADKELTGDMAIFDELRREASAETEARLRSSLGAFLFSGDDIYKPLSVLSGGERSRLALLKLLLKPHNVLILDEPTNHLDLAAKDVLLEALRSFNGTLLFVSHDTYFIRNLADRIFYMTREGMEIFEGAYDYFEWALEQRNRLDEEEDELQGQKRRSSAVQPNGGGSGWKNRNALKNRINSLKREEQALLERIEEQEGRLSRITGAMAEPENYQDGERIQALTADLNTAETERDTLFQEWEKLHEQLEEHEREFS
jgi:ATP-binding cassette, subfamily F, member 3